jgi:hypothetical protein
MRLFNSLNWGEQKELADIFGRGAGVAEHETRIEGHDYCDDDHCDAFRHALTSALLAKRFGAGFSKQLTDAHEMIPHNASAAEAMDLYNNEVGRTIFLEHPDASEDDLIAMVRDKLNSGGMVVVAPGDGRTLAFSGLRNDGTPRYVETGRSDPFFHLDGSTEPAPSEDYKIW